TARAPGPGAAAPGPGGFTRTMSLFVMGDDMVWDLGLPTNPDNPLKVSRREDLKHLVGQVEQRDPPTRGFHPLLKSDERSQLDAGDELDVGKVEQQVALPQAVRQTHQFPGEHVLYVPLLTGSERDDLHAPALFDFGLRTRTRTHGRSPSTKSPGVR